MNGALGNPLIPLQPSKLMASMATGSCIVVRWKSNRSDVSDNRQYWCKNNALETGSCARMFCAAADCRSTSLTRRHLLIRCPFHSHAPLVSGFRFRIYMLS
ncbi:hypothetical protein RB195_017669 [Necator americanus]|uniref:Uncharacterized protein n=1 Tax=Necator americanus TaxID=51031 RepID=A0ABR1C688_NECAM